MHVPPGGGPPPHRHDFEEMFTVLDGEVEVTFRGERIAARAGETINVPANAPHAFTNASGQPVRLLCMCYRPARRSSSSRSGYRWPPEPSRHPRWTRRPGRVHRQVPALAPQYRTELLPPPGGPR